jgi:hypothetical protein
MLRQTKAKVSAPERTSEAGRAVEAYWSGDDRRGYVMLFKNFELYVHPVDGGFWNALAIWPNESEEAIGRFRDKNTAMNAAATWANKNAGKPPKQSRLAGF